MVSRLNTRPRPRCRPRLILSLNRNNQSRYVTIVSLPNHITYITFSLVMFVVAEAYDFSRPGGGHYDIGARNTFYIVTEDEQLEVIQATLTNRYSAKLTGSLFKARPVDGTRRQSNFFGCSASQEADISKAAASAQSYASAALEYLESHTHGTSRFTTWFGSYTTGRHSTILSHFSAISGHDFSSFTYDCSCSDPSIYAYVYPNEYVAIRCVYSLLG